MCAGLVLGTWERPQLHDIVREYCISLYDSTELQRLQTAAVDAFAAARPISPHQGSSLLQGLGFLITGKGRLEAELGFHAWKSKHDPVDACAQYVEQELHNHALQALGLDASTDQQTENVGLDGPLLRWLSHYPSDDIHAALARALGQDRLLEFAKLAEEAGHIWVAAETHVMYGQLLFQSSHALENFADYCKLAMEVYRLLNLVEHPVAGWTVAQ
eukprot:SAG31_NODE_12993_length_901_cov_0.860349_2_plen_215_part_01